VARIKRETIPSRRKDLFSVTALKQKGGENGIQERLLAGTGPAC
jgi:hypothetical protein